MFSIKSALAKPFAKRVSKQIAKWANNPIVTQERVFQILYVSSSRAPGILIIESSEHREGTSLRLSFI